jgi:hypothetical protein
MSDFDRNDPAYRPADPKINDPVAREPVVVNSDSSGFGILAGIAVAALIAIGGFYFYTHSDGFKTASNDSVTTSSTPSPAPKTMDNGTPSATPKPATPPAATPPASTPAQ